MDWLLKLLPNIVTNRFVKSIARYVIAGCIGGLLTLGSNLPWLEAAILPLAEFMTLHRDTLATIVAGILTAVLGYWSIMKNKANAKIQEMTPKEIK